MKDKDGCLGMCSITPAGPSFLTWQCHNKKVMLCARFDIRINIPPCCVVHEIVIYFFYYVQSTGYLICGG